MPKRNTVPKVSRKKGRVAQISHMILVGSFLHISNRYQYIFDIADKHFFLIMVILPKKKIHS